MEHRDNPFACASLSKRVCLAVCSAHHVIPTHIPHPHSSTKKIPLLSLRRIPFFTKDDGKSNPVHEKTLLFGAGGASCATLRRGLYIVLALATVVGFSSINFNAAAGGKKAYTLHMMPDKGLHTARGAACLDGSDAGFYFRKGRWEKKHHYLQCIEMH